MIVEKVPSLACSRCGSFQVIMTDDGPECDECNRHVAIKDELISLGIDITGDAETLKLRTIDKENIDEAI